MQERFIGIEGISQRFTVAVMADRAGQIQASTRCEFGISLHTTPRRKLRIYLFEILKQLAQDCGAHVDDLSGATLCTGVSGTTFPYDSTVDLPREISGLEIRFKRVICTGDAEIAFASHLLSDSGGAILCHLGSTAYVTQRGEHFRYGGWGPVIGDLGSGYWMGNALLREIADSHDRNESDCLLWDETYRWLCNPTTSTGRQLAVWNPYKLEWLDLVYQFQRRFGRPDRRALFNFVHTVTRERGYLDWRVISSGLVIPLLRAYEQRDVAAVRIVDAAVESLAQQWIAVCQRAKRSAKSGPVLLYGGVITCNPTFEERLRQELVDKAGLSPNAIISREDTHLLRPAFGALLFALGAKKHDELQFPPAEVISTIQAERRALGDSIKIEND